MAAARRLCRAVRRIPCPAAPFNGWMVAVSGISKRNGPEHLALADLHEITERGPGRLSKIIERLKQAAEGARGVFKDGACACRLKFRKQIVLSDGVAGFAHENSRRRL